MTVSYFEWLKNLSHVQFGRLERRLRAATAGRFAQVLERTAAGRFSESDRDALMDNVDELAIVNSGLEDTMVRAYQEIRETKRRHPGMKHLRTAALVNAIDKIARAYVERGIFP